MLFLNIIVEINTNGILLGKINDGSWKSALFY